MSNKKKTYKQVDNFELRANNEIIGQYEVTQNIDVINKVDDYEVGLVSIKSVEPIDIEKDDNIDIEIETDKSNTIDISKDTSKKFKTKKCKIIAISKNRLAINFEGYGIEIKAKNIKDIKNKYKVWDTIEIQYKSEIGKPDFTCTIRQD